MKGLEPEAALEQKSAGVLVGTSLLVRKGGRSRSCALEGVLGAELGLVSFVLRRSWG